MTLPGEMELVDIVHRLKNDTKRRLFDMLQSTPDGRQITHDCLSFELDSSLVAAAAHLGGEDWRAWYAYAFPPHEHTVIEYKCLLADYTNKPQFGGRFGIINHDFVLCPISGHGAELKRAPYFVVLGGEPCADYGINRFVWGAEYCEHFGAPPIEVQIVDMENLDTMRATRRPGTALRTVLAALALINHSERHIERRIMRGRMDTKSTRLRRLADSTLLVIRPDSPLYRADPDAIRSEFGPSTRKREHDVRRHLRRCASGKLVWVRAHKRGDAALGAVSKERLVELDPNRSVA